VPVTQDSDPQGKAEIPPEPPDPQTPPTQPVSPEPKSVSITFISDPPGATVIHNKKTLGKTPLLMAFPAGNEIQVRYKLDQYAALDISFTPTEDRMVLRKLNPLTLTAQPTTPAPKGHRTGRKPKTPTEEPKEDLTEELLGD
jgi:hypothetical protein